MQKTGPPRRARRHFAVLTRLREDDLDPRRVAAHAKPSAVLNALRSLNAVRQLRYPNLIYANAEGLSFGFFEDSDVEENGLVLPLQHNIECVARDAAGAIRPVGEQGSPCCLVLD